MKKFPRENQDLIIDYIIINVLYICIYIHVRRHNRCVIYRDIDVYTP